MSPQLIEAFSQYGLPGIVIAALGVQVFYLQRKLVDVIENNTKAMTELRETIHKVLARQYAVPPT